MNQLSEVSYLIAQSDIFKGLPKNDIRELAESMKPERFSQGTTILEKGDMGDWMFIIQSGKVKVHNKAHTVAELGVGEVIGELSLLKSEVRSMSVTALEETLVFSISHDGFFNVAEKNPKLLSGIIGILVERLRHQTSETLKSFEVREQKLTKLVEERTSDLNEKNKELERTQKYKEQFLANMSHEIRTPMTAIMGLTNIVLESHLEDKQRNYLTSVHKASNNLLNIINEILDFSKIEAGKIELEEIYFSIRDVIDQVCQTLKHKTEDKGVELISNVTQEVPEVVKGDPARINQILINLAGNAIKYTEKGSVSIEVAKTTEGKLKFAVIDTGAGIPEDKLQHIFESFSQAHSSDSRKHGGTGLGLTISKRFIDLMGGQLKVKSKLGNGSTFYFEVNLPVGTKEELAEQNTEEEIDLSALNGLKILLVDDNEMNRVVCIDTLTSKINLNITEATNGKEALKLLKAQDFDLVLMDVQMPEMDGHEATRHIRQHFEAPLKDIPILALTASVVRRDIDRCKESGMNDYVPKPFKAIQLFSTIAQNIKNKPKFSPHKSEADSVEKKLNKEVESEIKKENDIIESQDIPENNKTDLILEQSLDLSYLKEFCSGKKDKMLKYINLFLDSVPAFTEKMEAALEEDNFEEIASKVHGFKMKFVLMRMNRAKDLGLALEQEGHTENPDKNSIHEKAEEVLSLVQQTYKGLKAFKKNNFG